MSPHAVMPCPPRMQPIALRVTLPDFGDVEPELEARAPPWHPNDLAAEDLGGETFTIGGRGDGDSGVGMQVVDVSGIDQPVHRGVDRRCRAAFAVQAEIEGGDHLVLTLDAGVDVDERPQSVESEGRQTVLGERAEVASGTFDPHQVDALARRRVEIATFRRRVAARIVGVPRVGAETIRSCQQVGDDRVGHAQAPQPA